MQCSIFIEFQAIFYHALYRDAEISVPILVLILTNMHIYCVRSVCRYLHITNIIVFTIISAMARAKFHLSGINIGGGYLLFMVQLTHTPD